MACAECNLVESMLPLGVKTPGVTSAAAEFTLVRLRLVSKIGNTATEVHEPVNFIFQGQPNRVKNRSAGGLRRRYQAGRICRTR
jgi:hypothetical protein